MAGAEAGMSGAGIPQQPQPQPPAAAGPADESSDSEGEHEGPQKLIRKVSTSGQIRSKVRGAGAGEPRCLRGKFLHPHPRAGAARSRGRPLHPARIPGSGGGGRGGAVRRPCLFLPSLSPPPRPAVASTSVPVWQEEPPGAAQLRGAGGEAACPGSRPALPGVLGVGGSGGAASPPAPLPRRRAPLPRGSRPASQRGGACFSQPFLTNFPFPPLPCPLIFFPPGPGGRPPCAPRCPIGFHPVRERERRGGGNAVSSSKGTWRDGSELLCILLAGGAGDVKQLSKCQVNAGFFFFWLKWSWLS